MAAAAPAYNGQIYQHKYKYKYKYICRLICRVYAGYSGSERTMKAKNM